MIKDYSPRTRVKLLAINVPENAISVKCDPCYFLCIHLFLLMLLSTSVWRNSYHESNFEIVITSSQQNRFFLTLSTKDEWFSRDKDHSLRFNIPSKDPECPFQNRPEIPKTIQRNLLD